MGRFLALPFFLQAVMPGSGSVLKVLFMFCTSGCVGTFASLRYDNSWRLGGRCAAPAVANIVYIRPSGGMRAQYPGRF